MAADWSNRRDAIYRALRIDPNEPGVGYATGPFTLMRDGEGRVCIGGAIGIWAAFNPFDWTVDQISDVILWEPRSGAISLYGSSGADLVMPDRPDVRLTVYADGFAFFRAWADQRAATATRIYAARKAHLLSSAEPADSDIPGALAIGDLAAINWCDTGAAILVAGPGIDPKQLNRAIIRSAHLPRVESMVA